MADTPFGKDLRVSSEPHRDCRRLQLPNRMGPWQAKRRISFCFADLRFTWSPRARCADGYGSRRRVRLTLGDGCFDLGQDRLLGAHVAWLGEESRDRQRAQIWFYLGYGRQFKAPPTRGPWASSNQWNPWQGISIFCAGGDHSSARLWKTFEAVEFATLEWVDSLNQQPSHAADRRKSLPKTR